MTHDSPPVALAQLVRRNRRRYGGYIVHAGLAVLLVGVAASSSFQHSHDVMLNPGQHVSVNGYEVTYVRPTAHASAAKVSFGAVLNVTKHGKHVTTLNTTRNFYPAPFDPSVGPISEAFNGQSDSDVGLRAGITKDIWAVINPNLQPLQAQIARGDKVFESLMTGLTPAQARQPSNLNWISSERAAAITGLTDRFVTHPWSVNFLVIVSPLVTWIWLGAIIIAFGGLIALWPVPALARRRRRAAYRSRGAAAQGVPARELA
jgi:cytochrome c-type biogenesis protein CcmF